MTKREPKQREVVRIQYYLYCPECNKEITGKSNKQVEHNLKEHMKVHKK